VYYQYYQLYGVSMGKHSMPAQSVDLGKDQLEDVAAEASPDPEPLPPNIYADVPQLDEG